MGSTTPLFLLPPEGIRLPLPALLGSPTHTRTPPSVSDRLRGLSGLSTALPDPGGESRRTRTRRPTGATSSYTRRLFCGPHLLSTSTLSRTRLVDGVLFPALLHLLRPSQRFGRAFGRWWEAPSLEATREGPDPMGPATSPFFCSRTHPTQRHNLLTVEPLPPALSVTAPTVSVSPPTPSEPRPAPRQAPRLVVAGSDPCCLGRPKNKDGPKSWS